MTTHTKILIIEDDMSLVSSMNFFLETNGFHVIYTNDGNSGWEAYKTHQPDIILLDIILPEKNGFEVASQIRAEDKDTPILFMTESKFDAENRRTAYIHCNANDFIPKPFFLEELHARIKNALKSIKEKTKKTISLKSNSLEYNHIRIRLSEREAEIMKLLVENTNQKVKSELLIKKIWKYNIPNNHRTLVKLVSELRKKLTPLNGFFEIETIYGTGYLLKTSLTIV